MGVVGHRARDDLGVLGAGEPEELVDLVTRDVGEDASGAVVVVEPVRAPGAAGEMGSIPLPVGPEPEGLHHPPDPALADQLARADGAAHLEPLRERDGPEPTGRRHGLLDLVELVDGDATGLVSDHVLAVAQGLQRDGRAAVRDGRGDDHVNGRIAEQGRRVIDPGRIGPLLPSRLRDGGTRVVGAEADQLGALPEQPADLAQRVGVVQADGGETDGAAGLICGHVVFVLAVAGGWHRKLSITFPVSGTLVIDHFLVNGYERP